MITHDEHVKLSDLKILANMDGAPKKGKIVCRSKIVAKFKVAEWLWP